MSRSALSQKTFPSHLTSGYEQLLKDGDSKSTIKVIKNFIINMDYRLGQGTTGKVYAAFDTDHQMDKINN